MSRKYILNFSEINLKDIGKVGGKNASLGELYNLLKPQGVGVLDGFATTAEAFRLFLRENDLERLLAELFAGLDAGDTLRLQECGRKARQAVLEKPLPDELTAAIGQAYEELCLRTGGEPELAVRSSATAEDLPEASFAGAAETFLNVRGKDELLSAVHKCFASLFTDRAINYRATLGYDHLKIALSVGVQPMVRSDIACAGVIFTLDTESGFRDAVEITSSYGLGEAVVQGIASPDEWTVFKPTLKKGYKPIIDRRLGKKEIKMVYAGGGAGTKTEPVGEDERRNFSLTDDEVLKLAEWACLIERHYSQLAGRHQPMDIEWAKDGITGELFIVQARPETVHAAKELDAALETYKLTEKKPPAPVVTGQAVGEKIASGRVRIVRDASELSQVEEGDVLVAPHTNPDWEPVMKRVAAIVTDQGGRTAHAAIVSRELGLPCIVGCGGATEILKNGDRVTVSCAEGIEGRIYKGEIAFETQQIDISNLPETRTKIMFNVADPEQCFKLAMIPNDGVGLARLEFIINRIGVHPMALALFSGLKDETVKQSVREKIREAGESDPKEFFVRRLAEAIGKIAASFYPKPVIIRTSDFKTNEYALLAGGLEFEPLEENPMLGWRGASRYTDERYAAGFALECRAVRRVRDEMGLTNVKVMIPFCRTVQEGRNVIAEMAKNGLRQGAGGLEIYAMCELPSNAVRAKDFLEIFDGYSIGSNDLTQLVLGIDRDSGTISALFDEEDAAVKDMITLAIRAAREAGKPIGICGQAPSDKPGFAAWLVGQGITSVSLNPDSAIRTRTVIAEAESSNDPGGEAETKSAVTG